MKHELDVGVMRLSELIAFLMKVSPQFSFSWNVVTDRQTDTLIFYFN